MFFLATLVKFFWLWLLLLFTILNVLMDCDACSSHRIQKCWGFINSWWFLWAPLLLIVFMHFPYLSHTCISSVCICEFEWNGCILKVVILISCNCVDLCYVIVRGMIWNISEVIVEVLIGRLCFGQSISCSMCNVKSMWPIWCSFFWEVLFWIFLDIGFLIYMYAVQLVGLL